MSDGVSQESSSELKRKAAPGAPEGESVAEPAKKASRQGARASGEDSEQRADEDGTDKVRGTDPNVVTFEVQGENFKVLTSTIRMQPDTLLCTLLDTENLSKPIFVEGDKALFPYILSWYRHASSMRINIPVTVSKAAMEQECRTFGLPEGVVVVREWENCTHLVDVFAKSMESVLEDIKASAQRQQALAEEKRQETTMEVQKAIKALEARQRQTDDDFVAHTLYKALLEGVSTCSTPLGSSFQIDSQCFVELVFGTCPREGCGHLYFHVGSGNVAIAEYFSFSRLVSLRRATGAEKVDQRRNWHGMMDSLKKLAAKDGFDVQITAAIEPAVCMLCSHVLWAGTAVGTVDFLEREGFFNYCRTSLRAVLAAASPEISDLQCTPFCNG